jgi:hypothetical protein
VKERRKQKLKIVRQKEADKKEKVTKKDVLNHRERQRQVSGSYQNYQGPNFLTLRSPRIDSKEPILPDCVAWRAGTTLFLLGF